MRRIQALPTPLRPREKLLKLGPQVLSIEELYAVILITGTRTQPVSTIAHKVSLVPAKNQNKEALLKLGIGPSKIAQILAAVELGKRLAQATVITLTSAEAVFAHSYEILHLEKEVLLCFYLNGRGELVKKETVAVGSLNRASVMPAEIFGVIKELPVAGLILVHNHPSGNLEASEADRLFTKRIQKAGEILGVKLLDHLIVGATGWKRVKL